MIEKIINLIFPPCCGICGKIGSYLCEECNQKLEEYRIENNCYNQNLAKDNCKNDFNNQNLEMRCNKNNEERLGQKKLNEAENKYFLYRYDGLVRSCLLKYKFDDKSYLSEMFKFVILNDADACNFISSYDIITAIPLHKKRLQERGYNQTELFIKNLPYKISAQYEDKVLEKIKNTVPQSSQDAADRIKNVKRTYRVAKPEKILNKKVLLVDDIYTTGSTCGECKKQLLEAGAASVGIFCIARDYMKLKESGEYNTQKNKNNRNKN